MVILEATKPGGDLIWSNVGAGERGGKLDIEAGRDEQTALGIEETSNPIICFRSNKSDPEPPLPLEGPLSWGGTRSREFMGQKAGAGSPSAPCGHGSEQEAVTLGSAGTSTHLG